MNETELRDFVNWLNVQANFTIDPVSTVDPDELIAAYLQHDEEDPYDDLALFLYERLDGVATQQDWTKAQRDWYRKLVADIVDFVTEEWIDEDDPIVVSASDLRTYLDWSRSIQTLWYGHTLPTGPVTQRLLNALEEVEQ